MLRSVRAAINPFSTGVTRWWCHSDLRAVLSGRPPGAYKRRVVPRGPMDESVRRARIAAIERAMARDDPATRRPRPR
jgi:hypothetical protein